MAVYIRHAKDRQRGSDTRVDTSITSSGKVDCEELARDLYHRFGVPCEIRCSPFRRGRQTAECLAAYLERKTKQHIPIYVDPALSRFNSVHQCDINVRNDTAMFGYVPTETMSQFKKRVKRNAEHALELIVERGKIVWHVTHAVVVKKVAQRLGVDTPETLPALAWVDLFTSVASWST